jgi:alpha-1,6-rhamnosyltransferase
MPRPFVSVLIDTYNHRNFIEQAMVSVLEQDYPAEEREILVVDDGSSDGTAEMVEKFAPRARLIRKANGGQASAFNAGIPECRGEIVAFLDGDDWWAPGKLRSVAEAMRAEPSVGIVGHGIVVVGRDGTERAESLREGFRFQAKDVEGAKLLRRRGAFLGTSRMTIRADVLRRVGRVPEAIAIQADEYLFTLAGVVSEARILPETLTYYRMHGGNQFQLEDGSGAPALRKKQKSLAALASALEAKLTEFGVERRVRRTILAYTRASAEQLRLLLDGGWPWETVKTEWTLYRIVHPEARMTHRVFKALQMVGALALPPKRFYGMQRGMARNGWYRRARERCMPAPQMEHIRNERREGW